MLNDNANLQYSLLKGFFPFTIIITYITNPTTDTTIALDITLAIPFSVEKYTTNNENATAATDVPKVRQLHAYTDIQIFVVPSMQH